jgi:hypothetical protein
MMQITQDTSFDSLVEHFLGQRLPRQLTASFSLPDLPPDARELILRMLPLMKQAGYPATAFSPALIRWLFTSVPSTLPSAWGGKIPPLTLPDRHRKLDAYVAIQNRAPGNRDDPNIFLDVGCGFPPVTTADTARKFPDWRVFGVDRSFADYILYDPEGHYACFDEKGGFQYFQAMMSDSGRALYADPGAAKTRFNSLFEDLLPLLENTIGTTSETVEKDGNRLIHHHVRDFETDNLSFMQSDITELQLSPAKVIRCMNVLIYFEPEIRKQMLLHMCGLLDEDGILIAGTSGLGIQSRYAVYQKDADVLFPGEFAFSLDNLGLIVFMPWFTLHDNDPEAILLAELAGVIRSSRSFWTALSNRIDALLQHHDICHRSSDGFLMFHQEEMMLSEYMGKNAEIWQQLAAEGYPDGAVDVLKQAGYKAWKNPVGDIAVEPHPGRL